MSDPLLAHLPKARRRWARTDPVMAALSRSRPMPARAIETTTPFEALATSIIHQQVSLAAGRVIVSRVAAAAGGNLAPAGVLAAGPDRLRAAGLSRPKTAYVLDLAERAHTGALDLDALASMDDAAVVDALTEVKGIGVWTAKMFLIFHLARPDVLAPEDLGLQIAVAKAYKVPRARAAAKMTKLAPAWSPYASLAALTLWASRRD
ncbi:MAG TPA: DNA-3-methyladenine glycosylase 2 family protein [Candidatus Thermoplasmatota archaeon]|nr:DNA-3-methyladenine glycosylase 2 family protein [Candidatus Thermoplasmatota archaeon]